MLKCSRRHVDGKIRLWKIQRSGARSSVFLSFSALCRRHNVDGKQLVACSPYPCSASASSLEANNQGYWNREGIKSSLSEIMNMIIESLYCLKFASLCIGATCLPLPLKVAQLECNVSTGFHSMILERLDRLVSDVFNSITLHRIFFKWHACSLEKFQDRL